VESLTAIQERIYRLADAGEFQQALELARETVRDNPDNSVSWFTLGKILWRLDRRSEATSAYRTAVDIDPDSPAAIALQYAGDIADFFNPDLFNP
jgi:cytochrome c-type biogenesis protein CcmH/NrfG